MHCKAQVSDYACEEEQNRTYLLERRIVAHRRVSRFVPVQERRHAVLRFPDAGQLDLDGTAPAFLQRARLYVSSVARM